MTDLRELGLRFSRAAPIDWAYDHALRLYPLPSLLGTVLREACVIESKLFCFDSCFLTAHFIPRLNFD